MDIGFSEDQMEIARQARRFLQNECPADFVRAMYDDERGFTDELWKKMAEMGWLGMHIPEEYGGIGLSMMDLCIVLEEMGRVVLPGPFFSTVLLGAEAILEAGSEAQKRARLPSIAMGESRGTLALLEPEGGARPGFVQMEAARDGSEFVLNGRKAFVPDAHVCDFLVVAARTAGSGNEGITLFEVSPETPGLSITPLVTMDGTRKQCAVTFQDACVSADAVLGEPGRGWAPLSRVLQRAWVGLTAENVGGAQRAMEIALDYAKMRHAFGQPIGAFQAIKHMCADMLVEVEGSRSILYYAAWAVEEEDPDAASLAASVAKSHSSEAYRRVASNCIQVLGAIGMTWEHDAHLYLKRARSNEVALGDTTYHLEEVARLIGC